VVAKWAFNLFSENPIVGFFYPNSFAISAMKILRHLLASVAMITWNIMTSRLGRCS
jgi:hypothetical protein